MAEGGDKTVRTARLEVVYDGEALRAGLMDVRDLAPALLSVGDLCQEANRVLNGDRIRVSVGVRSGFEKGSFEVNLEVLQSLFDMAKQLVLSDDYKTAREIITMLFGGGGLFGLIKWLKGRKPTGTQILENGNIRVEIGEVNIEINQGVYRLYEQKNVRKASMGAVKPLDREGIDRLDVKLEGKPIESVNRDEAQYFYVDDSDEALTDEETIAAFEIITVSFEERLKWRLWDGNVTITADIEDEDFFRRLQNREISFAKGDILKVRMHTRSWRDEKGLHTERKVLKVLEVISSPRQLPLSVEPPERRIRFQDSND